MVEGRRPFLVRAESLYAFSLVMLLDAGTGGPVLDVFELKIAEDLSEQWSFRLKLLPTETQSPCRTQ
jgi:hypothetical protein